MSAEQLASIAGIVLSLVLAYVPWLSNWYNAQTKQVKVAVMGGLLIAVALGVFGLGCWNVLVLVPCTLQGALQLLSVLISALMANQATFLFAVRPFKKI